MEELDQTPRAQARLVADAPPGDAVAIVYGGGRGAELVAIAALGEDSRSPRLKGPSARRARPLRPPIAHPFGHHRVALQDESASNPLFLHGGVAVGAAPANLGRDVHDLLGLVGLEGLAPSSQVSRPRAFPLGRLGRQAMGLDGPLCR
jgi:hypothetical protein